MSASRLSAGRAGGSASDRVRLVRVVATVGANLGREPKTGQGRPLVDARAANWSKHVPVDGTASDGTMRDFVERLLRRGEMRVIEREVDPRHELAAVVKRSQAESDLPLLFRRVRGSTLPVVSNLYGSRRRLCELIGAPDGRFPQRWLELSRELKPGPHRPADAAPSPVDLRDGRLSDLPQIVYWERDAGPYFTSAVFLAKEPDTGVANLSFHRAMYASDAELRIRLGDRKSTRLNSSH